MKQFLIHSLVIGCGCLASTMGALGAHANDAPVAVEHQAAVWQERQYSFVFLGFTSTYSCDGLADKLKVLLLAAGARKDVKATPGACASGFGRPDKFARADLTFYALVPAGASAPADESLEGNWRSVALAAHTPRELAIGDCELVEQFKTNVLPLFATRNIEQRTSCVPHQDSGSVIDLKFESLSAPPQQPKPPPVRP